MRGRPPTVNAFAWLGATSVPVVIITVRPPGVAVLRIVPLTVAWVGSVTVVEMTVRPVPNYATVVPLTKVGKWPTPATNGSVWASSPEFGVTWVIVARGKIIKRLGTGTTSLAVVTVHARGPVAAPAAIDIPSVRLVALATVGLLTV